MKKVLSIVGIIILIPVLFFGYYALENIYYNKMGFKVEKAAIKYLENRYGEHFEIDDRHYSKVLGDEKGWYDMKAHPIQNPEFSFHLRGTEKYQILSDDYKECKWANDAKKEYLQIIKPLFPNAGRFYASGSFTEEVGDRYNLNDTYQTILKENPYQSHEYINILMFESSFEKGALLNRTFQLWRVMKDRKLGTFRLEVKYYPKKLLEKSKTYLDLHEFDQDFYKETRIACRISDSDVISTPDDIAAFCLRDNGKE